MGKKKQNAQAASRFQADERIGELLDREPRAEAILLGFGLPCNRCVVKDFETLAEGCAPLGLRVDEVLAKLNTLDS